MPNMLNDNLSNFQSTVTAQEIRDHEEDFRSDPRNTWQALMAARDGTAKSLRGESDWTKVDALLENKVFREMLEKYFKSDMQGERYPTAYGSSALSYPELFERMYKAGIPSIVAAKNSFDEASRAEPRRPQM